jgi:GNAT superfamily N-acetyltransferase
MIFREATINDIQQIQVVRHSVKENRLSDPALVTDEDCRKYLEVLGKGWVCETGNLIAGFAIIDLLNHNIWALFVRPEYERMGIGKKLQAMMLDWYFDQTDEKVWLGTAPNTRAADFYRRSGWKELGKRSNGEIKFELSVNDWKTIH